MDSSVVKLDKKTAAMEAGLEMKLEGAFTSLQKSVDETIGQLNEKVDASSAQLVKIVKDESKRLNKMLADSELEHSERSKAEHKHFSSEIVKVDKKITDKANDLDVKFTNTCIRLEKQFATDQDEQDDRVNGELKYLREATSKIES